MMNVTSGQNPLGTIKGFKGLHMRGAFESCPPDHLVACNNCVFPGPDQVSIREPVTISSTALGRQIVSYFIANVAGGARLLVLDISGDLYDVTATTHLIFFGAGTDDIACLNIFGRTYISPKIKGFPVSNFVYVYDGTTFRIAAGAGPITTLTLAQVNPGNVSIGVHGVSVSYLSPTGYLTNPNPNIATITSTGSNDIEITGIPIYSGSSDAANWKRVILVTQANQTELFFLPGGTINDNTTTTLNINFFDTSLISSADYLFNLYSGIPAGSALRFYNGRMVVIGNVSAPDNILVSRVSDPESFDKILGVVSLPRDYGLNTTKTAVIILGVLYPMKPNGTYSTQDNGGDPSTWPVYLIDSALGAWDNGVSLFSSSSSSQDVFDSSFIATRRGLMLFQAGTYQPVPFSKKIEGLWNLIDPNRFDRIQVAQDVWLKRVYVAVTLNVRPPNFLAPINSDSDQFIFVILMMDYQEGLNPDTVKWSTWTSGLLDLDTVDGLLKMTFENFTLAYAPGTLPIYQLSFCVGDANIYKIIILNPQRSPTYNFTYIPDLAGIPINQFIVTPPSIINSDGVFSFTMFNLDVIGHGNLQLALFDRKGGFNAILVTITGSIATGVQTVTPFTMPASIFVGANLFITNPDGSNGEIVVVTAVTLTTFTANFTIPKTGPGIQLYTSTDSILKSFNLGSFNASIRHYNLQRLINFTSEGMQIVLWNDQNISSGNQGFFQLSKIDIYGKKMWQMRPALTES